MRNPLGAYLGGVAKISGKIGGEGLRNYVP